MGNFQSFVANPFYVAIFTVVCYSPSAPCRTQTHLSWFRSSGTISIPMGLSIFNNIDLKLKKFKLIQQNQWGRLDSNQLTINLRLTCDEPLNLTIISEECYQEYKTTLHSSPFKILWTIRELNPSPTNLTKEDYYMLSQKFLSSKYLVSYVSIKLENQEAHLN